MDKQIIGIITLLRSALKGEALTLPADFDWKQAAPLLYQHHLAGLAVRGAARCGIPGTHPEIRQLTALFCRDIAANRQQMQQLQQLYTLFDENEIDYMPVKGAVVKTLYPKPELRVMGDADLLIREAQYDRIRQLLPTLGMKHTNGNDYHYEWKNAALSLELHTDLMPPSNPDYFEYYRDVWIRAKKIGQGSAWAFSPEDHYIFLMVHFAKHYRIGDINAKNICDFWVYRNAYPNLDEAYLRRELEKLHLLTFCRNISDLLQTWFDGAPATQVTQWMTQTIFRGGVYQLEESAAVYNMILSRKGSASVSQAKRKNLSDRLFPPMERMVLHYPVLKKHPVLLPVFWLVRLLELLRKPGTVRRGVNYFRNVRKMDDRSTEDYEAQLKAVGLEFNF